MVSADALTIFSGIIILFCNSGKSADFPELLFSREERCPQHRAFAESGAANAAALHDPTREKGIQKRPQAFLNPELKIIFR